jgi:Zn-dependent metalloprotease
LLTGLFLEERTMEDFAARPPQAESAKDEASRRLLSDVETVVPPYILSELAKHNPGNNSYSQTLEQIEKLEKAPPQMHPRASRPGTGAREVYDAQGQKLDTGEFGEKARFEGEEPTGDREVDGVYDYTGNVREFYKSVFGRNSIDDNGMKFISRVNYGQNFQNAYWDGMEMTYGRPASSSAFKTFILEDVTAHEITHGVTQHDAHLAYRGQAGALNESLSDVFGELAQQWSHHQKARDASWVIGDGIWKSSINGRGLRDMLHPGTAYDDPTIGKDPQPADMAHYVETTKDNGGVHINSGIPNRAFAEFAIAVGGYAWEEAGHVWYAAMQSAGSNPTFSCFAKATVDAANSLGFGRDISKLERAWQTVGVSISGNSDSYSPYGEEDSEAARAAKAARNAKVA